MTKTIKAVIEQILNLKWLEGRRTTVLGATIVALNAYQGIAIRSSGLVPVDPATFTVIMGVLIERLAHFAKKHKD